MNMSGPSTTHCPTCGAPIREDASKFCAFCGTKLPEPPKVVVQAAKPNARERFEAAQGHANVAELLRRTPSSANQVAGASCSVVFLVVFCLMGGGMTIAFAKAGAGALFLIPMLITFVGLILLTLQMTKTARFATAQLDRTIALVVDERVEVSGGKHASTTYYATLERSDRSRREFEVHGELAGKIAPNDMGMAYTKDDVLLDFQRIDV